MAIQENPYLPPASRVADAEVEQGAYVDGGRSVPPAHGWEWLSAAWSLFRRQPGTWILVTIILFLLIVVVSVIPFVGSLALPLFMPVLLAGLMRGCEKLERGESLELADLFSAFQTRLGPLVLLGAIGLGLSMAVTIPLFVVLFAIGFTMQSGNMGIVFVIVFLVFLALLLPVYMALWFGPPLVGLQDQEPTRAIGQSFRGCLRNIVPFLVDSAIVILLAVVATIPLGLGWLVLGPVIIASVYTAYRDIYFDS